MSTGCTERFNQAAKEHAFLQNIEPGDRSVIITMMIDSWLEGAHEGINRMSANIPNEA